MRINDVYMLSAWGRGQSPCSGCAFTMQPRHGHCTVTAPRPHRHWTVTTHSLYSPYAWPYTRLHTRLYPPIYIRLYTRPTLSPRRQKRRQGWQWRIAPRHRVANAPQDANGAQSAVAEDRRRWPSVAGAAHDAEVPRSHVGEAAGHPRATWHVAEANSSADGTPDM